MGATTSWTTLPSAESIEPRYFKFSVPRIWEINVTHSGAWGNKSEDHWLYWVQYIRKIKEYASLQPYNPEVFVVRRREYKKSNCSVSLQNGEHYIVGYWRSRPNFVWVRPRNNLTYEEKKLLKLD
ncbi:hypothetical protein Y032_0846g2661 [Ancylostoma ceylanicum]|uniref:Uncharacterized protein n=1 Tax=Ancylostoma ceylanicum TaxID=53326 RepID=A0A016WC72_9BILA|nr:hypothetical protein Y032_0846g2661 [Ancylostoma ceylanicum]